MMDAILFLVALLLSIAGIVGCIVPALPGTLLSYAGLLCAGFTAASGMSAATLWAWLAVAVAVTVADFVLPGWMTRRFGGSRAGSVGATVGIFAGFLFFPPLGIVLGPFVGALVGELLHDGRDRRRALRVGVGAFLSFVVGTGLKLVMSLAMFVRVLADAWPVLRGVCGM